MGFFCLALKNVAFFDFCAFYKLMEGGSKSQAGLLVRQRFKEIYSEIITIIDLLSLFLFAGQGSGLITPLAARPSPKERPSVRHVGLCGCHTEECAEDQGDVRGSLASRDTLLSLSHLKPPKQDPRLQVPPRYFL